MFYNFDNKFKRKMKHSEVGNERENVTRAYEPFWFQSYQIFFSFWLFFQISNECLSANQSSSYIDDKNSAVSFLKKDFSQWDSSTGRDGMDKLTRSHEKLS